MTAEDEQREAYFADVERMMDARAELERPLSPGEWLLTLGIFLLLALWCAVLIYALMSFGALL